jgi:hypothetical protein
MLLLDLPNELLCQIYEALDTAQDITSFSQLNHHLHRLTEDHLYQFDAQDGNSSALLWAAAHGELQTTKKALKALQRSEQQTAGSEADENTRATFPSLGFSLSMVRIWTGETLNGGRVPWKQHVPKATLKS